MINLNSDYIKNPLIFAASPQHKQAIDNMDNYVYLWDSPMDKKPVFLIKDTKEMNQNIIVRMHSSDDFITKSIHQDIITHIKNIMNAG